MSQRHSPAVSYPLHRARSLQVLWGLAVTCAAAVLVAWWFEGAGRGQDLWLRVGFSTVAWLLCAVAGWRALVQMPQGVLQWDGKRWIWIQPAQVEVLQGTPVVVADLQSLLVLHFACGPKGVRRFLLQRNWAPHLWLDLRRAVYSLAYPTHDAAKNQVL